MLSRGPTSRFLQVHSSVWRPCQNTYQGRPAVLEKTTGPVPDLEGTDGSEPTSFYKTSPQLELVFECGAQKEQIPRKCTEKPIEHS